MTAVFATPEQIKYLQYDEGVDVWAFGCVLACLAHGQPSNPYRDVGHGKPREDHMRIIVELSEGSITPAIGLSPNHCLHAYVQSCCSIMPSQRPTAALIADELTAAAGAAPSSRP